MTANFKVGNLLKTRVAATEFLKQKEITIAEGYEFVSCAVYFAGTGFPSVQVTNLNGKYLSGLNPLLQKCAPGSSITFADIKIKTADGIRTFDEKSYILY